MRLPDKEDIAFTIPVIIVILGFFYFTLGFSGALSVIGITILFFVPTYFLLGNLNIDDDEKILFSFFIGAGIFPSIVYWLGLFISFRLSIFIAFIVLVVIAFFVLPKYQPKLK